MTKLVDYTVARAHQGDRITDEGPEVHLFREGETRTANPAVVAELVKNGVLIERAAAKSDPEPIENKSEGDAEKSKAEPKVSGRKAKGE